MPGLPELYGAHTGNNIASVEAATLRAFGVDEQRVRVFCTRQRLQRRYRSNLLAGEFGFGTAQRRLRCCCHILNLGAQVVIWGKDREAFGNEGSNLDDEEPRSSPWKSGASLGQLVSFST